MTAIAATAVAAPAAGGSADGAPAKKTPTVKVGDDYFAPTKVEIKPKNEVKFKWLDSNLNTHNVKLTSDHPKDVKPKDFKSVSGSIGVKFSPEFEVPGNYGFICTFHRTVMKMDVKVKRPANN